MSLKISELPVSTEITANDIIPFTDIDTLVTKKISFSNFKGSFIEQDEWEPDITFDSPGDLSVSYVLQNGYYYKIDRLVFLQFQLLTATFTHTTSTGLLQITGLPFPISFATQTIGSVHFGGITMAGYTHFTLVGISGQSVLNIGASGSGQGATAVAATDVPTGGTLLLYGTIMVLTI